MSETTQSPSAVVAAMHRAGVPVPAAIDVFDRAFGAMVKPDDVEHSMRVDGGLDPWRLTSYFDVARRGERVAQELGQHFARLCDELGLPIPGRVRELLTVSLPRRDEVLQIVEGIDAGDPVRGVVVRHYLVFRKDPEACVREVLDAIDGELPPNVDARRAAILGLEIDRTGVADCKLYFELEREGLPRVVANFAELQGLAPSVRSVMFQVCVRRPHRRQLYLHMESAAALDGWLHGRGPLHELVSRRGSLDAQLAGERLEPWIIAFPWEQGRVDLSRCNVYFHLRPAHVERPAVPRSFAGPLEWMQHGDVVTDYTLVPYEPIAQLDDKLRSVNLLYESFALAGVEAEGRQVVELLRSQLGPYRTGFGVKLRPPHELGGWELYFYDQKREHPGLSIDRVKQILAPALHVDAQPPPDVPWHMFSVEAGVSHLRRDRAAALDVYVSTNPFQKGTDRSYKVTGSTIEFENVYSFHHPQTGVDQWLYRLTHGVHYHPARHSLAALVPPELVTAGHLCVANKRRADALYFSRITHEQLCFALGHFGVDGALPRFLADTSARFEHLLWDVGIDFVARGAALEVTKVGVYGSF